MTRSTCLHIQDRESGPIRVVELPGVSVRIGRAPHCEIQLTELSRAEEVCRLLRRGSSWQLVPNGSGGPIRLEGRSVSGCCQLPFDVPFFVGGYRLWLRHDVTAEPDWGNDSPTPPARRRRTATLIYSLQPDHDRLEPNRGEMSRSLSPEPSDSPRVMESNLTHPQVEERGESLDVPVATSPAGEPGASAELPREPLQEDDRAPRTKKPPAPAEEIPYSPSPRERWETRWRAASAELKARAERARAPVEPLRPAYQAGLDPVPLKEPSVPRSHPVTLPSIDPAARPVAAVAPSRVEPSSIRAKAEPSRTFTQPDLPWARKRAEQVTASTSAVPAAHLPPSWAGRLAQDLPPSPQERRQRPLDFADGPTATQTSRQTADVESPSGATEDHRTVADQPPPTASGPVDEIPSDVSARADKAPPSLVAPIEDELPVEIAPVEESPPVAVVSADEPPSVIDETREDSSLISIPAIDAYVAELSQSEQRPLEVAPAAAAHDQPAAATLPTEAEGSIPARPAEPAAAAASRDEPIPRGIPSHKSAGDAQSVTRATDRLAGSERPARLPEPPAPESPPFRSVRDVEWPSARDVLASHQAASSPRPVLAALGNAAGRKARPAAIPTLARRPGHWSLPVWVAGPPAALFVLAAGFAGCFLSWRWAGDSYTASVVTDRLLSQDKTARSLPLPDSVSPPDGSWTSSTSGHLARWAIYHRHFQRERNISIDETVSLLERALQVSPLDHIARLALAQLDPSESRSAVLVRSLGLSRDAVSLTQSARRLLAAGEKQAALVMYGKALAVAMPSESFRAAVPRFSDDAGIARYFLPGEEQVHDILRELLGKSELSFADWSGLLPRNPIVFVAAARLLRERDRGETEAMLDQVLQESSAIADGDPALPVALAARAEAFALRSQWRDADRLYRQAIELAADETIRRSWWFNVADVASRLEDDGKRQAALQAAVANSDDITRRAVDVQRASRPSTKLRTAGVKAN
jgi:tetratricopeptide (TPR) repeat protein